MSDNTVRKLAVVWFCPNADCRNYYASSSMGSPLSKQENKRTSMRNSADEDPENWSGVTGTRDECPDCRAAGRPRVRRVPINLLVTVPTDIGMPLVPPEPEPKAA